MSRALLITESAEANPRLLFALRWARDLSTGAPPVLATLSRAVTDGVACASRAGVEHLPLGARAEYETIEIALTGLCDALSVTHVLLWDCPRAVGALHALRNLSPRPEVFAHVAPPRAVAWDELNILAIRGRNLIDHFLVEDEVTASELDRFRLGRAVHRVGESRPTLPPRERSNSSRPAMFVRGGTWRNEQATAAVAEQSSTPERSNEVVPFPRLLRDLLAGTVSGETVVFPDADLASAAPVAALNEAGLSVQVADGRIEERLVRQGAARWFDRGQR